MLRRFVLCTTIFVLFEHVEGFQVTTTVLPSRIAHQPLQLYPKPNCAQKMYQSENNSILVSISRRKLVSRLVLTTTTTTQLLVLGQPQPQIANAAEAASIAETIRQTASQLPGNYYYGPTDVFYPVSMRGMWKMHHQITFEDTTTTTRTTDMSTKPTLKTFVLEYPVRFLPSLQDDAVVADRGFNQANFAAALFQQLQQQYEQGSSQHFEPKSTTGTTTSSIIRSYQWTEDNPNDIEIEYTDGTTERTKVTKRSSERTSNTIQSSELKRIVQTNNKDTTSRSIPKIIAHRVMTKWKTKELCTTTTTTPVIYSENNSNNNNNNGSSNMNENDDCGWEGIELVYIIGSGGSDNTATTTPKLLSKSRLYLERY